MLVRIMPLSFINIEQKITTQSDRLSYVVISPDVFAQKKCTTVKFLIGQETWGEIGCYSKSYKDIIDNLITRKIRVITFDSKSLHHIHLELSLPLLPIYFDIKLAGYLVNAGRVGESIQDYVFKFLDSTSLNIKSPFIDYALYKELEKKIDNIREKDIVFKKLLYELEIPLTRVIAQMESKGIKLDVDYLKRFSDKLSKLIKVSEKQIFELSGEEFNIASPKQLGEVLFLKLKLPGGKKGKNGSYSTNERILRNLVNDFPIIQEILNYRELAKLKSTYTTTLLSQVNPKTGRIHSIFHQDVTSTGRLSSTNPNLQNIPISTQLGQEVRRAFIADNNKKFIFFDYSQQELRLLAHLSGDKSLQEAFKNNVDIHALTTSRLLRKPIEEITSGERRIGKTVNFGIVYGISAFGLSEGLKIDPSLGQKYIDSFFSTYPAVKDYLDRLLIEARKKDYITTILGRRKNTQGLKSPVFQVRKATEREIINFPLQGSAADMVKMAMVKAQEIIDNKYRGFANLILQIHDELIFEIEDLENDSTLSNFAVDIENMMLSIFKLSIPMKVNIEVGYNLADSVKFIK